MRAGKGVILDLRDLLLARCGEFEEKSPGCLAWMGRSLSCPSATSKTRVWVKPAQRGKLSEAAAFGLARRV